MIVGVVRAVGVVGRRMFAGRTAWRVTESLTSEVIERVVAQPVPWHRQQRTATSSPVPASMQRQRLMC